MRRLIKSKRLRANHIDELRKSDIKVGATTRVGIALADVVHMMVSQLHEIPGRPRAKKAETRVPSLSVGLIMRLCR